MQRRWMIFSLVVLLVPGFLLGQVPAQASRLAQDDPVAQCAEGIELFLDGRATEAAPLLEAGFCLLYTSPSPRD